MLSDFRKPRPTSKYRFPCSMIRKARDLISREVTNDIYMLYRCFLHVKNVIFCALRAVVFLLNLHCKICLTWAPAGPYSKLHGRGPILASTTLLAESSVGSNKNHAYTVTPMYLYGEKNMHVCTRINPDEKARGTAKVATERYDTSQGL
jgi:hypothetical protein